ncbi:MAG: hemerythrin family protein [Desulfuromonadaceae bacterium]|nr:hemerythrin family protein [Desulfuromonadaceae bacterium]
MAVITWKSCYKTGIPTFDAEHRTLVDAVNSLYEGIRDKRGDEVLGSLFATLLLYTKKHFQHEEEFMLKYHYPAMEHHKQEHHKLKESLVDYQERFQSGYTGLSAEVFRFLRTWLLDHILETDMQFGEFLRQQNVQDCGSPQI